MAVLKLNPHRRGQLRRLVRAGAVSRDTAVAIAFDRDYHPGTLARMARAGWVEQAQMPFHGDSRRRVSHCWLTSVGRRVAAL